MTTANRGEWAEPYIAAWCAARGEIRRINEYQHLIEGDGYEVLGVRRVGDNLTCWRNPQAGGLELRDDTNRLIKSTPVDKVRADLKMLLGDIKAKKGSSFTSEAGERIMQALGFQRARAGRTGKADMELVVRNQYNGMHEHLQFSAKSMISSNPTIFNASQASCLVMQVLGISWGQAEQIMAGVKGTKAIAKAIRQGGGRILPHSVPNPEFLLNLRMIDEEAWVILSKLVILHAMGAGPDTMSLCKSAGEDPEFFIQNDLTRELFELRVRRILIAMALGMTAGTKWDGTENANAGNLNVYKDGNVCYLSPADRDGYGKYLLGHTKFDTPSPGRFPEGVMERQANGDILMKMNFQVRWTGERAVQGF